MTTLRDGRIRDGWGVYDDDGFRIEDSPYAQRHKVAFTRCDVAGSAIAMVMDVPRSPELHARLAATERPTWIDAIGHTTLVSAPDEAVAKIEADLIALPAFDRRAIAFAAAIVLYSDGTFEREPDRYEVRIGDRRLVFSMWFDDDNDSWSADFEDE